MTDPLLVLNEARALAGRRGYACSGWTLQEEDDGFAAWLFVSEDDRERSLFDSVELQPTALLAAQNVLVLVGALPIRTPEASA